MKLAICGAGPGGLYLGILLKRADPRHEVAIYERNAPGATYGWGVVFSDESLAELRDADYETYLAIDEALVRWSAIDIHYAGRCIRSYGHGFAAIARTELLNILSARAAVLGVDVRHEEPVADLDFFDGCDVPGGRDVPDVPGGRGVPDVIVGADGIRSTVRAALAEHLGTTLTPTASRYVWYGAPLALPVFTFIFLPTIHGLFQVHAYPYDASASTFIVECSEATWRAAGLDAMSEEESLVFCSELFAPWLGGRKLRSNKSLWSTFMTVRNRAWHHGRAVLLGDAAHTAHFSIGSGTRLAMDDAIALAKAFVAHPVIPGTPRSPSDPTAAFAEYEGERQPVVERFQEVATDSARYFESVGRYIGFAPEQFAFNLLTRSGRITHGTLTQRDPVLVNEVDGWFTGTPARLVSPPPLLAPLTLGATLEVPNRVALAPSAPDDAVEGIPGAAHAAALSAAATTGAGLVVTEAVAPAPEGRVTSGSAGIWTHEQTMAWADIVADAQAAGTRVALRLTHAGRRGACAPRHRGIDRPLKAGWPLLAASALPYGPRSRTPWAIDRGAMAAVVRAYAAAAARGAEAGFDLLLLDMSDGYLLAGFLSPLANHRTDDRGGALENRMAFPLAVLDAVTGAWPAERPLGVRLLADDRMPGGLTADEGSELARLLRDTGVSLVEVTAGGSVGDEGHAPDYRRLYNTGLADRVRNEAGVRVMVGGHITRLDEVNTLLAAGRADVCVLDPSAYTRQGGRL
ncbi:MAG: FAD-dependent monooxygenase [Actinomycetota bacterium]|nr:FAD-dependent monooxygenase [Actinomycetota bacterium]